MVNYEYIYGPVPSRRLGISLGISPIPKKTCNYSCIYCQLGRTNHMTNKRKEFFPVEEIISEFEWVLATNVEFDVVTIVGEGEPTLYLKLGELIDNIKERTEKAVAVITNGALLYDKKVQDELCKADIVMPSMDVYDEKSFRKINRPSGNLDFFEVYEGLEIFSKKYQGQLWMEIMLMDDINDREDIIEIYSKLLEPIEYDKLYLNTPVRPPAESNVKTISDEKMKYAMEVLKGISIELLVSEGFYSEIEDHFKAIISIIKRHPMNRFEIKWFLKSRGCNNISDIFNELEKADGIERVNYKCIDTYRLI